MELFPLSFTVHEIVILRQSLDTITINGKDAQFISNLQLKLEQEIENINNPPTKKAIVPNDVPKKKTTK